MNSDFLMHEMQYWKGGGYMAGADEAGRGPLAGPVVAAAVIFPKECIIEGINDSKKLTEKKRRDRRRPRNRCNKYLNCRQKGLSHRRCRSFHRAQFLLYRLYH